ncbi:MAG: hypothetical protein ABSD59_18290 [Terracidiphilus sp.]|jgi:hypothetical protein
MKNLWVPITEEYKTKYDTSPTAAASDEAQSSEADQGLLVGTEPCTLCGELFAGEHYLVKGHRVCKICTAEVKANLPVDTHEAFFRALAFGVAGSLLGFVIYSSFELITGITIGFLALAVGWIVAKAMLIGSKRAGGRRYQIAAVILTYAAISLSSIPVIIGEMIKKVDAINAAAAAESAEARRNSIVNAQNTTAQLPGTTAQQPAAGTQPAKTPLNDANAQPPVSQTQNAPTSAVHSSSAQHSASKRRPAKADAQPAVSQTQNAPASAGQTFNAQPSATATQPAKTDTQDQEPPAHFDLVAALPALAMWGLIGPFLELRNPTSGIIGLVILFVGLRIAYGMTKAKVINIEGPFSEID